MYPGEPFINTVAVELNNLVSAARPELEALDIDIQKKSPCGRDYTIWTGRFTKCWPGPTGFEQTTVTINLDCMLPLKITGMRSWMAAATMLSLGACTIEATQNGGVDYSAANPVQVSFTVMGFTRDDQAQRSGGISAGGKVGERVRREREYQLLGRSAEVGLWRFSTDGARESQRYGPCAIGDPVQSSGRSGDVHHYVHGCFGTDTNTTTVIFTVK
jgi:hypothetical protein